MTGVGDPQPRKAFAEAFEFHSQELRTDPNDFEIEWKTASSEARKGRWQSLLAKDGATHTGRFIAHGLPSGTTVHVRVVFRNEPSRWVEVETLEFPEEVTEVQRADPFGNPLGGIRGLCSFWVLNLDDVKVNHVSTSLRCMRCGCETVRHSRQEGPMDDASFVGPTATTKQGLAAPKAAIGTTEKDGVKARVVVRKLLKPRLQRSFCEAVEMESEVLAKGSADFRVEWMLAVGDETPQPGQENEIVEGSWQPKRWANPKAGEFLVDHLPPGKRVLIRVRAGPKESPWVIVETRPLPAAQPAGRPRPGLGGACAELLPAGALPGAASEAGCLRCGRPAASHPAPPARDGPTPAAGGLRGGPGAGAAAAYEEAPLPELQLRGRVPARGKAGGVQRLPEHGGAACDPPPLEGGLQRSLVGHLEFFTNFDGSNGELFVDRGKAPAASTKKGPNGRPPEATSDQVPRYHVVLRPDPSDGTESTGRKRWFYFGVRAAKGADSGVFERLKIRLVVNNMSNMTDLFNLDDHRPFYRNVPNMPAWRRIPEPCRFACCNEGGAMRKGDDSGTDDEELRHQAGLPDHEDPAASSAQRGEYYPEDECLLSSIKTMLADAPSSKSALAHQGKRRKKQRSCYIAWDFEFDSNSGTTYFAFSPPYGYADMQEYLGRLEAFFQSRPAAGTQLPDYMPKATPGTESSSGEAREVVTIQPKTVEVTIEHAATEPTRRMKIAVRKDATLLQVRQCIMEALGVRRLSEVKLVRRLGRGSESPMTSLSDAERLGQRTHLLMLGREFPDGLVVTAGAPSPSNGEEGRRGPGPGEEAPLGAAAPGAATAQAAAWLPRIGASVYFHRQRLCITKDGRRVDLLTVSECAPPSQQAFAELPPQRLCSSSLAVDGDTPARDLGGRRVVFVSARVHPGETPGQFALLGFLQFVLSNDPRAELLRKRFVFKLVPMMNPDGVARGHTRANSKGLDLNRCYSDPNPAEHESVFWVLEWLVHWANQGRLLVYVDMHAHAHTRGCVLYGNHLQGIEQLWNIAFAKVCQLNAPHFDFDGCEFPPISDKEHGYESTDNSGRARVASACRLYHAYTLECHYSIGRQTRPVAAAAGLDASAEHPGICVRTTKQVPFGVFEWESIGEAIAVTTLDLHGKNPHKRNSIDAGAVLDAVAGSLQLPIVPQLHAPPQVKVPLSQQPPDSALAVEARLWRVVSPTAVVRDGPGLDRTVLDAFSQGQLVSVLEEVPGTPWVKLAVPDGYLGGKLNARVEDEAFMLTDGSELRLGKLLERTELWVWVFGHSRSQAGRKSA